MFHRASGFLSAFFFVEALSFLRALLVDDTQAVLEHWLRRKTHHLVKAGEGFLGIRRKLDTRAVWLNSASVGRCPSWHMSYGFQNVLQDLVLLLRSSKHVSKRSKLYYSLHLRTVAIQFQFQFLTFRKVNGIASNRLCSSWRSLQSHDCTLDARMPSGNHQHAAKTNKTQDFWKRRWQQAAFSRQQPTTSS